MPLYLSQHTDYTCGTRPGEVDRPAEPLIVEATTARRAMQHFADTKGGNLEFVASETTLVLLDPVLQKLRSMGYRIEKETDAKQATSSSL